MGDYDRMAERERRLEALLGKAEAPVQLAELGVSDYPTEEAGSQRLPMGHYLVPYKRGRHSTIYKGCIMNKTGSLAKLNSYRALEVTNGLVISYHYTKE